MNRFENKTVLITGGSSGISSAGAERLIQEGEKVIITGRTVEHLIYTKILHKYKLFKSVIYSFLATFLSFLLWEIIRMGLYPFDLYDIAMTFSGCVLSTILILSYFIKI